MNPELIVLFERLAWIEAYLFHYEDVAAVLDALEVDRASLAEARQTLAAAVEGGRLTGDLELAQRYASELLRARATLIRQRATLDEIVLFVAIRPRDGRALPDVALAESTAYPHDGNR